MRKDKVVREVLGSESAITPSEMCNQQFKRALFWGYDPTQVDAYLARAADQLESLIEKVRSLKEQQEDQKAQLEEHRQMEATLRSALVSSQKFGEEIIESAKRQAEGIIAEARAKQRELQEEASRLPESLTDEIRQLQDERRRLRSELLAILDTHRMLLDRLIPEQRPQPRSQVQGADRAEPDESRVDVGPEDCATETEEEDLGNRAEGSGRTEEQATVPEESGEKAGDQSAEEPAPVSPDLDAELDADLGTDPENEEILP